VEKHDRLRVAVSPLLDEDLNPVNVDEGHRLLHVQVYEDEVWLRLLSVRICPSITLDCPVPLGLGSRHNMMESIRAAL
jgi:hypothetical protein